MPKMNYSKSKAKKAFGAIRGKLMRLHADGYISAKTYISLDENMKRHQNKCR
jgi:hypothetical protein